MFHSKKINQWYSKHEKKIIPIVVILLIFVDIYLIVDSIFQTKDVDLLEISTRIMASISTLIWTAVGIMNARNKALGKFFTQIFEDANKLYFHGLKLTHFLESDAILRLEAWLGVGMCFELSSLAMLLLKRQRSAKLCRGELYDEDGNVITKHSWVEVKIPLNGWYVVDFAWMSPAFCKRRLYYRQRGNNNLVQKWTCSYDDFWKTPFAGAVYEAMQNRTTSCILLELSGFGTPSHGYDFRDWARETKELKFSDGNVMIPHYRSETSRPISSRIIRDFVKNPRRQHPKAKSIRIAQQGIRKYNAWVAKQSAS